MESQDKTLEREEYWKAHILKAREFSGSDESYCRANGLSKGAFYVHKRRLGFTRPPKAQRTTFVKVTPTAERHEVPAIVGRSCAPDPKWLAQFLIALLGQK